MPRFNTMTTLGITAISSIALLAGCDTLSPRVYDFRVMKVDHVHNSALDIVTANGSIVAQHESRADVAVEVELYGHDEERLDFATVHADRMGDDTLRVWVDWPGGKRRDGEGAKIEVYIPDAVGVRAKSSNGSVTVKGLQGEARVNTSNGSIHLDKHKGPMILDTSNGSVRVENSLGNIKFDTSNGRIIISDADGEVQGDTSNGNVYISTLDGASGPIRVRTTNGRVELDLGYGFEGAMSLKTSNGRIKTDGLVDANLVESSDDSLKLQMGESTVISAVETSNGSIRVHGRSGD